MGGHRSKNLWNSSFRIIMEKWQWKRNNDVGGDIWGYLGFGFCKCSGCKVMHLYSHIEYIAMRWKIFKYILPSTCIINFAYIYICMYVCTYILEERKDEDYKWNINVIYLCFHHFPPCSSQRLKWRVGWGKGCEQLWLVFPPYEF